MTHSGHSPVEPLGEVKAVADGSAQMLTTLTTLRDTLRHARLPLEIPGVEESRHAQRGDHRPARGLRAAPARADRRSAARRRWRVDRRRQVDPGELPGRRAGQRARRTPTHDAFARARPPSRRLGVVRQAAHPPGARAHRAGHPRPGCSAAGRLDGDPTGTGTPGRPRHRLRRGAQPQPGRAAARRGRPVAVRHLGGALRRPGAMGVPQAGRRSQCGGGDRARPHPGRVRLPR